MYGKAWQKLVIKFLWSLNDFESWEFLLSPSLLSVIGKFFWVGILSTGLTVLVPSCHNPAQLPPFLLSKKHNGLYFFTMSPEKEREREHIFHPSLLLQIYPLQFFTASIVLLDLCQLALLS